MSAEVGAVVSSGKHATANALTSVFSTTPPSPSFCDTFTETPTVEGVLHVAEAVLGTDPLGPALDRRALDLHRAAALAAEQVVVVAGAAGAVDRLTLGGAQHVDRAVGRHRLQRPVDRGEADPVAGLPHDRVELLGGAELLDAARSIGLEATELVVKTTVSPPAGPASPPLANARTRPMSKTASDALQAALASLRQSDSADGDDAG